MNRIIVSFPNHYNPIFIDRAPDKHKTWKFHDILMIPFQDKPNFLLICTTLLFQLKNVKNNLFGPFTKRQPH